jgi:hypothetical protein
MVRGSAIGMKAGIGSRPPRKPARQRRPWRQTMVSEQMRDYGQCIIRDSARHSSQPNYYIVEGAQSSTVSDQLMKKEIIVQGAAWGHLHDFLIEQESADATERRLSLIETSTLIFDAFKNGCVRALNRTAGIPAPGRSETDE